MTGLPSWVREELDRRADDIPACMHGIPLDGRGPCGICGPDTCIGCRLPENHCCCGTL